MSKTGLKVVTFEVGFVAQMPKCFSPTLVAALVGMLMVVGEAQQQEQLGEGALFFPDRREIRSHMFR